MTDLVVNRWERYGKRRLYVNQADGARVGWMDLVTGERHLEVTEMAGPFEEALARTAGDVPAPAPQSVPSLLAEPPQVEPAIDDNRDLVNRPGELVRARAQEEWEAAKDRSLVGAWTGRLVNARTDERSWRVGAKGEEIVGPRLEKLGRHGWRVLHSVPAGSRGSDIDHVLVGPGGVFTLNTKRHPRKSVWVGGDTVMVGGQRHPYVRNSRLEARRAERLLSHALGRPVPVVGGLVVLTATPKPRLTVRQPPDDVLVLDLDTLLPAFKRRKGISSADEVEAIFEVARWSQTWTSAAAPSNATS